MPSEEAHTAHCKELGKVFDVEPPFVVLIQAVADEDTDEDHAEPGEQREIVNCIEIVRDEPEPEEPGEINDDHELQEHPDNHADDAEHKRIDSSADQRVRKDYGDADTMEHTENHVSFLEVQPCPERDQHASSKNIQTTNDEFFLSFPCCKRFFHTGVAQGEGHADEQEEHRPDWIQKQEHRNGRKVNVRNVQKNHVEHDVVDDHHNDRDAAEEIDLPEAIGGWFFHKTMEDFG